MEQFRSQMAILKQKLEHQTIVNDKLIRQAVSSKIRSINRKYLISLFATLFGGPYIWWFFAHYGYTVALAVFTSVFFIIAFVYTLRNWLLMRRNDALSTDLVQTLQAAIKAKRRDARWLWVGIPFLIIWYAWFIFETCRLVAPGRIKEMVIGSVIGAVIGLSWGLHMHFKSQRQYKEIIAQINDITKEN